MKSEKICLDCGYVGTTKRYVPGNIFLEMVLWCFMILPGLFYSLWRMASAKQVCRGCGGTRFVPLQSTGGQMALKRRQEFQAGLAKHA